VWGAPPGTRTRDLLLVLVLVLLVLILLLVLLVPVVLVLVLVVLVLAAGVNGAANNVPAAAGCGCAAGDGVVDDGVGAADGLDACRGKRTLTCLSPLPKSSSISPSSKTSWLCTFNTKDHAYLIPHISTS
jgi:hypothetical protein